MSLKISIITPSYNSKKFIEDTIQSIYSQTYSNYEHIVIDGKSTDGTLELLKKYPHISWISEKDTGQSNAINKGFKKVIGDIIAWQNSDDLYLPNAFQLINNFFTENPDIDIVYGNYQLIDEGGNWICNGRSIRWNEWLFSHGRFVPMQPTVFFRRRVLEKLQSLDEQLTYCMDVDFYARATNKGLKFRCIPTILGQFRVHQDSKTQNPVNIQKTYNELKRVLSKTFSYSWIDYIFFEIIYFLTSKISRPLRMHFFK